MRVAVRKGEGGPVSGRHHPRQCGMCVPFILEVFALTRTVLQLVNDMRSCSKCKQLYEPGRLTCRLRSFGALLQRPREGAFVSVHARASEGALSIRQGGRRGRMETESARRQLRACARVQIRIAPAARRTPHEPRSADGAGLQVRGDWTAPRPRSRTAPFPRPPASSPFASPSGLRGHRASLSPEGRGVR